MCDLRNSNVHFFQFFHSGIHFFRSTIHRNLCFKIYDKAIEQNITDKGLLRIEFCYSVRGLKYAKVGRTLETFLTPDSINALLICYRKDYKTYFIDRYWNNKDSKTMIRDTYSQPIYEEMITIVYNDLCEHNGQPLTVKQRNRDCRKGV